MNKVITINLNGIAYQLEESGYDALREYLDTAAHRLAGNPDRDEIIGDIEQAIGDKFRALLGAHKTVVVTKEVLAVIEEMGPVENAAEEEQPAGAAAGATTGAAAGSAGPGARTEAGGAAKAADGAGAPPPVRRLYCIREGAMIAGVCNGIGAYFGIDPTFVRIGFVVLTFFWGAGILVYLLMAFLVPTASTPAEKAAATGVAATAQEFINRAKAGYYEGMKHWHDKAAYREWKRRYKQEMRGWKRNFQQSMHEGARSMHENAQQWQQNWQAQWGAHPRPFVGPAVWPLLGILRLALAICMIFAVVSLVGYGHILGFAMPSGIPLWVGVVFVFIFFNVLSWPLRALKWSWYCQGPPYYGMHPRAIGLVDSVLWLVFVVAMIWVADHYSPHFHEWLRMVPGWVHDFLEKVRAWWQTV
ncbi:MAG TPA: PspC domain-containing protein [Lacunisphaera sp.]|jgi:phage shock protein PspC (stress-responsive transcriptional regulator)|nr:PspC domain-containing protein [Lacunisphaera sp.]